MVTAFIELPGGTQLVHSLIHGDPLQIVLTLLWILFVLTVPLASWERRPAMAAGGAAGRGRRSGPVASADLGAATGTGRAGAGPVRAGAGAR